MILDHLAKVLPLVKARIGVVTDLRHAMRGQGARADVEDALCLRVASTELQADPMEVGPEHHDPPDVAEVVKCRC